MAASGTCCCGLGRRAFRNDNELLIGRSATAFNVRLVRCAVDGLSARDDVLQVMCRSEIDDVGAWAMALDEAHHERGGSHRGGGGGLGFRQRKNGGVVPGSARVIGHSGIVGHERPASVAFCFRCTRR